MKIKKLVLPYINFANSLLFFLILGIILPFILSISLKNGGYKTISSQNDMYKIIDNYYNPDEFFEFRKNADNINTLASFYNTLEVSDNFKVLSAFNQAIPIDDFKGDSRFYYNSEAFIDNNKDADINIKALQLNKEAYDFYGINIEIGNDIKWEEISYQNTSIPVLLGYEYKNIYSQGEIIIGNYYGKIMEFEVSGFLEKNCTIKYNSIIDLNLDSYMVIPYPQTLWNVDDNFEFESILYFAMINCNIISDISELEMIKEIKEIANTTGFTYFSIVGIDDFQIENIQLLLYIKAHQPIFVFILFVLFIWVNIITIITSRSILKINKDNLKFIKNSFGYYIVLPMGIACLSGFIFSIAYIKKFLFINLIAELFVLMIVLIFTYLTIMRSCHTE